MESMWAIGRSIGKPCEREGTFGQAASRVVTGLFKCLFLIFVSVTLVACGKSVDGRSFAAPSEEVPQPYEQNEEGTEPELGEEPIAEVGEPEDEPEPNSGEKPAKPPVSTDEPRRFRSAALWAHVAGSAAWTDTVLRVVRQNIGSFEKARDKEAFCPGYASATKTQREICWLRLVGGVVKFESNFNPRASFREKNGTYSVGLMMLSVGECRNAPTNESLKNGSQNLSCGVAKMAQLIARAGFIDGPPSSRGAASYWSVLRPPYKANGYSNLGKRNQIIAMTKRYKHY